MYNLCFLLSRPLWKSFLFLLVEVSSIFGEIIGRGSVYRAIIPKLSGFYHRFLFFLHLLLGQVSKDVAPDRLCRRNMVSFCAVLGEGNHLESEKGRLVAMDLIDVLRVMVVL